MTNLKEKIYLKGLRRFYWYFALCSLGFMLPILVLFWQENGLSMTQIMVLQSIFAISVVALEVPTGYIADVWSRKKSLVLGSVFFAFAFAWYLFADSFWQFAFIELLYALGISLRSGADSAFLYDFLKEYKKEHLYGKIFGKAYAYNLLMLAGSNIIGGLIGAINYRYTFAISLFVVLITMLLAFSFKEPARHKMVVKKGYVMNLLRVITHNLRNNKRLRLIIIFSAVVFGFNQSALWLYQPYFSLTGLEVAFFGIVFASFQLVAALVSKYAHKIEAFFGMKHSLFIIAIFVSGSFLLMGNFIFLFSFTFGFLQQSVRSFSKVVFSDYVNKLADSSVRATILSVQNMFGSLLYALIIPFIGLAVDVLSLQQALIMNGILGAVVMSFMLIILHRKKVI